MKTVSISEFKATCLALIKNVNRTGDPIVITLRGEPVAQVIPAPKKERTRKWLGSVKGTGEIIEDTVAPTGERWEVTEEDIRSFQTGS